VKILVASDTHKSVPLAEAALKTQAPADLLIHLGDYVEDGQELSEKMDIPLRGVRGDNDFHAGDTEIELEIDGVRIFVAHGHSYNIDEGLDGIYEEAKRRRARVVLFGHSHEPKIVARDGVVMLNPGNLCLAEKINSFAVIRIEFPKIFLGIFNPNQKGFIDVREI
jgi:hypothetical protein